MKSKWVSTACVIILIGGLFLSSTKKLYASEDRPMIDGSYLTHDNESIGYDTKTVSYTHLSDYCGRGPGSGGDRYAAGPKYWTRWQS